MSLKGALNGCLKRAFSKGDVQLVVRLLEFGKPAPHHIATDTAPHHIVTDTAPHQLATDTAPHHIATDTASIYSTPYMTTGARLKSRCESLACSMGDMHRKGYWVKYILRRTKHRVHDSSQGVRLCPTAHEGARIATDRTARHRTRVRGAQVAGAPLPSPN